MISDAGCWVLAHSAYYTVSTNKTSSLPKHCIIKSLHHTCPKPVGLMHRSPPPAHCTQTVMISSQRHDYVIKKLHPKMYSHPTKALVRHIWPHVSQFAGLKCFELTATGWGRSRWGGSILYPRPPSPIWTRTGVKGFKVLQGGLVGEPAWLNLFKGEPPPPRLIMSPTWTHSGVLAS